MVRPLTQSHLIYRLVSIGRQSDALREIYVAGSLGTFRVRLFAFDLVHLP